MKFKGITKVGQDYLAKCLAENKPVTFSKVEIGSGNITEQDNPTEFISLKTLKKEVGILSKNQTDNRIRLEIEITNDDEIQGFYPREVGIYVSDNGQDKLYCYINEDEECSYLPPASEAPVKFKYGVNFLVTSGESVIINWNGKELWVDKEYLEIELAKKEPKFSKNTAFNKNKTDSYNVNDSNLLATAKALYNLFRNISDSVSSTSSTIFASLKGVKSAYDRGTEAYNLANTKEPKITKKTAFNLDKSDNYNLNDTNILFTTKGAKDLLNNLLNGAGAQYDTLKELQDAIKNNDVDITELLTTLATKEPKFNKNTAFNKNLGTSSGTVLEGKRLAETLGIPYGGILNNSSSKVAGTAYYDNTTKKTYKCTSTTSLDYAESTKFEAISNNDLLLKFQNFKVFGNKMSTNLYSANRKSNVEYTNTSNIFRLVYFRGHNYPSNGSFLIYIDGQNVCSFDGYGPHNVGGFFIVPPGSKYKIYANGATLEYWYEY